MAISPIWAQNRCETHHIDLDITHRFAIRSLLILVYRICSCNLKVKSEHKRWSACMAWSVTALSEWARVWARVKADHANWPNTILYPQMHVRIGTAHLRVSILWLGALLYIASIHATMALNIQMDHQIDTESNHCYKFSFLTISSWLPM